MPLPSNLSRRAGSWQLLLLAVPLCLIAVFIAENRRGESEWIAAEARLRAAAEPLTLAEWLPNPPADESNFVMNPVFVRRFGFGVNQTFTPERWDWPPGRLTGQAKPDGFPYDAMGALDGSSQLDLKTIAMALPPPFGPAAPSTESDAAEAVLSWSQQWETDFAGLAQAAKSRPHSLVPGKIEIADWSRRWKNFDGWMDGCRLLQLRALAQTVVGDSTMALDSVHVGLRMAECTAAEPSQVIGVVLSAGASALCLRPIQEGLQRRLWSDSELQLLDSWLTNVHLVSDYRRAVRGERIYFTGLVETRLTDASKSMVDFGQPVDPWFARVGPRGWWRQNQVAAIHWQQTQETRLRKEPFERPSLAIEAPSLRPQPYSWFFRFFLKGSKGIDASMDEVDANFRLARLALALERHFLAHGRYPDALAELTASSAGLPSRDPFSGHSLHYSQDQGRPKLWSSGPNQRDDGGLGEAGGGDDIVWAYPER